MSNTTGVTKVVISDQYGGFSLSDEAVREYLRRSGREWTETPRPLFTQFDVVGDDHWYDRDIPRTDPLLVTLVEEMGDAASGRHAHLVIVALPKGTHYLIDEYDGFESLHLRDETEWLVA